MELWLAEALRDTGVAFIEVDGWKSRSRPYTFTPAGLMVHHTGGHNDLLTVVNGRPDLAGPLANLYVHRSGLIRLVAAGYCNHAGAGSQQVLDRVVRDLPPRGDAADLGLTDNTTGNAHFIGIEVENYGVDSDPYPRAQLTSLERACAAICHRKGWTANRVIHHREWTRRKVDMSYRGPLRATVAALLDPRAPEDISIVDDQTRQYLDSRFEATHQDAITILRSPVHPSLDQVMKRLDAMEAKLDQVIAGQP